jgi:hypothetical protein
MALSQSILRALNNQERLGSDSQSDQLVLDGIAGGGAAGGDLDFAVDGGEVVVDGARADDELVGDLRIGQSLCQKAQHINLAGSQAIGIGERWSLKLGTVCDMLAILFFLLVNGCYPRLAALLYYALLVWCSATSDKFW